jgi:ABC-type phosphate transport system substrate-binding protein
MGNTSMKFIAGAIFMCLASAASAATTLVGGGATLPAIGYTGAATNPAGSPITPAAGSLFGSYGGNPVTYCPTGSGAGKKVLAGNDPTNFQVNGTCGSTTPTNFGGVGLTQAFFAGSDAPLSLTEYNNYVLGHGTGTQPTQLPAIAGAVGIAFKKTGVNALTLNEDQICGVFSGRITDWKDLTANAVTGPINIAYRSDGSGTSFSFLNHLSAVCPTVAHPATSFQTLQAYATGASSYFSAYASSVGASGNAGVTAAVAATDGSIGYAEVANGVPGGVKIASVTNTAGTTINPLTGFGPTAIAVNVVFDKAIADAPATGTGRPVLVSLPVTGTCVGLVSPDDYANPASGYPIIAITNLLGNKQGNGTDTAAVRTLLGSPYNTAIRTAVTKIGRAATGYAWLSNAAGVLSQTKVDSCIVN